MKIDGALLRGVLEIDEARIAFAAERPLLGRDEGCDIRVNNLRHAISRKHVELDHANGVIRIRDLQSPQGIFINRKHVASDTPWPVKEGDRVRIGTEEFLIRIG